MKSVIGEGVAPAKSVMRGVARPPKSVIGQTGGGLLFATRPNLLPLPPGEGGAERSEVPGEGRAATKCVMKAWCREKRDRRRRGAPAKSMIGETVVGRLFAARPNLPGEGGAERSEVPGEGRAATKSVIETQECSR